MVVSANFLYVRFLGRHTVLLDFIGLTDGLRLICNQVFNMPNERQQYLVIVKSAHL